MRTKILDWVILFVVVALGVTAATVISCMMNRLGVTLWTAQKNGVSKEPKAQKQDAVPWDLILRAGGSKPGKSQDPSSVDMDLS